MENTINHRSLVLPTHLYRTTNLVQRCFPIIVTTSHETVDADQVNNSRRLLRLEKKLAYWIEWTHWIVWLWTKTMDVPYTDIYHNVTLWTFICTSVGTSLASILVVHFVIREWQIVKMVLKSVSWVNKKKKEKNETNLQVICYSIFYAKYSVKFRNIKNNFESVDSLK